MSKRGLSDMSNYKIKFKEDGLWWCGIGDRCNSQLSRTDEIDEADTFDDVYAVLRARQFKSLGYDCNIVPDISIDRKLEILEYM